MRVEVARLRNIRTQFMIHILVFACRLWITVHHNNLLKWGATASHPKNDIEYDRGLATIGFGGQQHTKRMGKVQPIPILGPTFVETFVMIFERYNA